MASTMSEPRVRTPASVARARTGDEMDMVYLVSGGRRGNCAAERTFRRRSQCISVSDTLYVCMIYTVSALSIFFWMEPHARQEEAEPDAR